MSVESFIALRYLKAKRKQAFISFISVINLAGVALGVAALIIVLAVMTGFQESMTRKMLGLESHFIVFKYNSLLSDWRQAAEKISSLPEVLSVEPQASGQILATGYAGSSGAVLKGLVPDMALTSGQFNEAMIDPPEAVANLNHPENYPAPPVILGSDLALTLGVGQGDVVTLISPLGRLTPLGGRAPLSREFTVAGLVSTGMYTYDSSLIYANLKSVQEFMNFKSDVTLLEVKVRDIYQSDKVLQKALALLGDAYNGYDWKRLNHNFFLALKLEKVVMFIILTLTILVAAFNIISTLIMVVMEKVKEIAILKSMGATRRQIRKIFLFQGLMIGVMGTAIGAIVGLLLCFFLDKYKFIKLPPGTYYLDTVPVEVMPVHVLLTCFTAVTVSLLATIYPAAYASRLDPVEALRYE